MINAVIHIAFIFRGFGLFADCSIFPSFLIIFFEQIYYIVPEKHQDGYERPKMQKYIKGELGLFQPKNALEYNEMA